jgi:hypothetical protein
MKDVKKGARPGLTKEKPAAPAVKAKALAVASAAKVAAAAPPTPRPVEKPAPVAQAKVEAPKVEVPKVAAQRSEPAKAPVPPAAPAPVPAVAAPVPTAPVAKAESAKPAEQPKPKADAPVPAKPVSAAGVGAVSAPAISQAAAAPVAAVLKSGGDQANVVFAKAQENSEALRKAAAASANAVAHGFIEINNKVLDLLRAQSDATFALWRSTVEAGSLSDAIRVQSSGVRQAYETTASQWRDIAETTGRVVEEAVKPIRQVLTPGLH